MWPPAAAGVMAPRASGPMARAYESEQVKERPFLQPLVVFRDDTLFSCSQDRLIGLRRDFNLAGGEKFDTEWFHKWNVQKAARRRAATSGRASGWPAGRPGRFPRPSGSAPAAGGRDATHQGRRLRGGAKGGLAAVSPTDGQLIARSELPPPSGTGWPRPTGRLFVTTRDGQVVCLGKK